MERNVFLAYVEQVLVDMTWIEQDVLWSISQNTGVGLCILLTDGWVEIDNDSVERTIRPIALKRNNAFLAGRDTGAGTGRLSPPS
jgi:hypothetical protein